MDNTETKLFRPIATLMSSTVFAHALAFLMYPIITRLYSPESFGVYGSLFAIFSALLMIATLRTETFLLLVKYTYQAHAFILLGLLTLVFVISIVMTVQLSLWFFFPDHVQSYFWYLPMVLFVGGCYKLLHYWQLRQKAFFHIALKQGINTAFITLIQILLGFFHFKAGGLLLGDFLGRSFMMIGTGASVSFKKKFKHVLSFKKIYAATRRYLKPLGIHTLSTFFHYSILLLAPVFMVSLYGSAVGGVFILSQRILLSTSGLISQAMTQVYSVKITELLTNKPEKLGTFLLKTTLHLALVALLPFGALMALAPKVFGGFFGEIWQPAGIYASYLSIPIYLQFIAAPIQFTLNALDKHSLLLYSNMTAFVIFIVGMAGCYYYQWNDVRAVTTIGVAIACMHSLTIASVYLAMKEHDVQRIAEKAI